MSVLKIKQVMHVSQIMQVSQKPGKSWSHDVHVGDTSHVCVIRPALYTIDKGMTKGSNISKSCK